MQEFVALLGNGHTWYWDEELSKGVNPISFAWVDLDGSWVVTKSYIQELICF